MSSAGAAARADRTRVLGPGAKQQSSKPWFMSLQGVAVDNARKRMMDKEWELIRSWGEEARAVSEAYHKHEEAEWSKRREAQEARDAKLEAVEEVAELKVECLAAIPIVQSRRSYISQRRLHLLQQDRQILQDIYREQRELENSLWQNRIDLTTRLQQHSNQSSLVLKHLGSLLSEQAARLRGASRSRALKHSASKLTQKSSARLDAQESSPVASRQEKKSASGESKEKSAGGRARESGQRGASHKALRGENKQQHVRLHIRESMHALLLNSDLTIVHEDRPRPVQKARWVYAQATSAPKESPISRHKVARKLRVLSDLERVCLAELDAIMRSALRGDPLSGLVDILVEQVLEVESMRLQDRECTVEMFKRQLVLQALQEEADGETHRERTRSGDSRPRDERWQQAPTLKPYGSDRSDKARTRSLMVAPPAGAERTSPGRRSLPPVRGRQQTPMAERGTRISPALQVNVKVQRQVEALQLDRSHLRQLLTQLGFIDQDGLLCFPASLRSKRSKAKTRRRRAHRKARKDQEESGTGAKENPPGKKMRDKEAAGGDVDEEEDEQKFFLAGTPEFLKGLHSIFRSRVLMQSRFYYEIHPHSPGNKWIFGYGKRLEGSDLPAPSATNPFSKASMRLLGVSSEGSLYYRGRCVQYAVDVRGDNDGEVESGKGSSLSACNSVGLMIDVVVGVISLNADGKELGVVFGLGAGAFSALDQHKQARLIRSGRLVPVFALRGPTGSSHDAGASNDGTPRADMPSSDRGGSVSAVQPELSVNFGRMSFVFTPSAARAVDLFSSMADSAAFKTDSLASVSFSKFHRMGNRTGSKSAEKNLQALLSFGTHHSPRSTKKKALNSHDSSSRKSEQVAREKINTLKQVFLSSLRSENMRTWSVFPPRTVRTEMAVDIILRAARRYLARKWRQKKINERDRAARKIQRLAKAHYKRFVSRFLRPALVLQTMYRQWSRRRKAAIAHRYGLGLREAEKHASTIQRYARGMIARKFAEAQRLMLELQLDHVESVVMLCQRLWRARMHRVRQVKVLRRRESRKRRLSQRSSDASSRVKDDEDAEEDEEHSGDEEDEKMLKMNPRAMFRVNALWHEVRAKTKLLQMGVQYSLNAAEALRKERSRAIQRIHARR